MEHVLFLVALSTFRCWAPHAGGQSQQLQCNAGKFATGFRAKPKWIGQGHLCWLSFICVEITGVIFQLSGF